MQNQYKTLGEKRVRVEFNVKNDSYIDDLKKQGASFIDNINMAASNPKWDKETVEEWARLKALAMSAIEEGTMWAVKAATI